MPKIGPKNSLCDVAGLRVGNAQSEKFKTGTTAVICDTPTVASQFIMGGGPGTRDIALLEPENTVETIEGVFLSGGSAFGADAGSGVQAYLREQGKGFEVLGQHIPIVPGAIIFDLVNGGDKDWGRYPPYRELGYEAAENASSDFAIGTVGAGFGALVADLNGGLGTASLKLENGITIAALVAVNSLGTPCIGDTPNFWAAPFEMDGEFGGMGMPTPFPADANELRIKHRERAASAQNTTIGVIATDAKLTKAQCKRLAIAAHDGYARAIWPSHTPLDGDLVFGLSTGTSEITPSLDHWIDLSAHAASVMSRAIARGIFEAKATDNDIFPVHSARR